MLNKNEDKIMFAVYTACSGKESCLLSPDDILSMAGVRGDVTTEELEKILESLEYDGYFDLVYSDRKGEKIYCITMHEKGRAYKRQKVVVKRNLSYKLVITVVFAVLSFAIGLLLKVIFS